MGKVIKEADAEQARPNLGVTPAPLSPVPDFLQPEGGGLSRGCNDTVGGPQEGHFHGPRGRWQSVGGQFQSLWESVEESGASNVHQLRMPLHSAAV